MTACTWRYLVGIVVAYALLSPSEASAKGFFLVTWGDTISHVGAISGPQALDVGGKVGYKSSYFGVFWIDLWTWGGTYCIYAGDRYQPIQPAEAAQLVGKQESDLSPPFLYRFPLGWLIFGPLIVLGIIAAVFDKRTGNEAAVLFQDARYQKALEITNAQYAQQQVVVSADQGQEAAPPTASDDETRYRVAFEAGAQHLVGEGIDREEAERNLALMIRSLAEAPQQQVC